MIRLAKKLFGDVPNVLSDFSAASIARLGRRRIHPPVVGGIVHAIEPRRISLSEQWGRLADIVRGAADRAEDAARCQASAALQIDLAQYALISLVDELAAVMDIGDRRRTANVHVLEWQPTPPLAPLPFGDAIAA